MIAGTSFSLQHGDSLRSDVAKEVSIDYLSDFQILTMKSTSGVTLIFQTARLKILRTGNILMDVHD